MHQVLVGKIETHLTMVGCVSSMDVAITQVHHMLQLQVKRILLLQDAVQVIHIHPFSFLLEEAKIQTIMQVQLQVMHPISLGLNVIQL